MNLKKIALTTIGAAALAAPGVASAHTAQPHQAYPTLASYYYGTAFRNILYFENRVNPSTGWLEGGTNARDYQVAANSILGQAAFGADVRPEVTWKKYWYVLQEGMSPYYNGTQGDIVVTNGAMGTGGWCGGQAGYACYYFTMITGDPNHQAGGLVVLNDSYNLSAGFKKRVTRHEIGHAIGLGHTNTTESPMAIQAPCHVQPDPTDPDCYWFNTFDATDSDKAELWNVYTHQYNHQGWTTTAPVAEASTKEGIERPGKFKPFTVKANLTKTQKSKMVQQVKRFAPGFYAKWRTGTIAMGVHAHS